MFVQRLSFAASGMEDDKCNTPQEVFLEVQMKVIAAVVKGLLEEALKDYIQPSRCSTIKERGRSTIPSKQRIRNKLRDSNKPQSHLNTGS